MSPRPLPTKALYEEVAELLRERIFARELGPGDWIDEVKLAQEYGISRTPMREAIKVLAAEGLVTMKMRRGAYVTEVDEQDLREVYHLLSLLESDAAGDVAEHASDEELATLSALHKKLDAAQRKPGEFFRLNEQFHLLILSLSGNRWRHQMVMDLRKVMKLNRQHSLLRQGRIAESLAEHERIMQALMAHQRPAVVAAVQQHFANGLQAASP